MKELVFATGNQAKLARYERNFERVGMKLISMKQAGFDQKIEEPFESEVENALHKARVVSQVLGRPVFAVDEGMTTNFLAKEIGVCPRRLGQKDGPERTDEEIIAWWTEQFATTAHPDPRTIWNFVLAYVDLENGIEKHWLVHQYDSKSEWVGKTWNRGYPMSALMSPVGVAKPYVEFTDEERGELDWKMMGAVIEEVGELVL